MSRCCATSVSTVGTPVIAPDDALSISPVGSVPLVIDQTKGLMPPLAVSVCEYEVLISTVASDVFVIESGGLGGEPYVTVNDALALRVPG